MTPRVFVSSTVRDLLHLRHAIRDVVIELGYETVMSDFGEIGYLPDRTAADSCFKEAEGCDLGVLIVGKRYGDDYLNNVSVTHGEFRTLHARKVPVVTLVEKDVLTYKALVHANKGKEIDYPGMDHPLKTFALVEEIGKCPYNNGIHEFLQLSDARRIIRQQFGHIFGNLLRDRFDPLRGDVKDILAAITTLRDQIHDESKAVESNRFLLASRELLEDECQHFKKFMTQLCGGLDLAVRSILKHPTFDELLTAFSIGIEIVETSSLQSPQLPRAEDMRFGAWWDADQSSGQVFSAAYMLSTSKLYINDVALGQFRAIHGRVRSIAIAS